jgi:hypothetical protein
MRKNAATCLIDQVISGYVEKLFPKSYEQKEREEVKNYFFQEICTRTVNLDIDNFKELATEDNLGTAKACVEEIVTKISTLSQPVEQPPVEQPPVEQPPVEQPPVEQPPVEQKPAPKSYLARTRDFFAGVFASIGNFFKRLFS